MAAAEEKEKLAKETTANMYAMNAQLKIIKQELKEQEALEQARRDAEVQVIEERLFVCVRMSIPTHHILHA